MQAEVDEMIGAPGLRRRRNSRGIRCNSRDSSRDQHRFDLAGEPRRVSWFENHIAGEAIPQDAEERAGDRGVKSQAWRKLHQYRTEFASESRRLRKKLVEGRRDIHELRLMRDCLRKLDREPKVVRHRCGPSLVRRKPVRTIEARVDLDGVEQARIALQVSTVRGKAVSMLTTNVPAGGAEVDRTVE